QIDTEQDAQSTSLQIAGEDPLLTNAQMRTEPVPYLPEVRSAWGEWVRSNYHPIRSLTSGDFSDLEFLGPLLRGKRVVQLGENGHGVAEFNSVKVRLIKYLHRDLGFDLVAFESGIWDCWVANGSAA